MSEEQPLKSRGPSKSGQQIRERLAEDNPEAILFDDLDDALIGVTLPWQVPDKKLLAVYSKMQIMKTLMFKHGISPEDVVDHFHYNIEGQYTGKNTPVIVEDDHDEAWEEWQFIDV
jgi:hypothetical protein